MNNSDLHQEALSPRQAANDRFKKSFNTWLWGSVLAATALHFAMFMFWPDMTAANASPDSPVIEMGEQFRPEIEVPAEPEAISPPAIPVIAELDTSILRDAGIGGTVLVHFFIDEEGTVQQTLVATSSGTRVP